MKETLQIGFIPLIDAAALLVAVDKGFTAAEGLDVTLVCEVSWSNVRDKLNIGLFDAAHILAPVPVASSLGLGHIKVPIVVRLSGTNAAEGREILKTTTLVPADTMQGAAAKIVALAYAS